MFSLSKDNLHHAYILEGEREALLDRLLKFLDGELGITIRGNPDFYLREVDSFGIDDARTLKERASMKSSLGGKKIFIVASRVITDQAQNALLKLFEEPTADTHFFLLTQNALELLPTLRSRMIQATTKSEVTDSHSNSKVKTFIKATPSKRIDIIAEIVKELTKDEEKGLVKGRAQHFLSELELEVHKNLDLVNITQAEQVFLKELLQVREYLQDQGSSPKMLLEHISLLLPR